VKAEVSEDVAGAEEVTAVGEAAEEEAEEEAVTEVPITVIHIEMTIEVGIMEVIIEGTTTPTEIATQEVTEIVVVVAATAIKVAAAIITRTPTSRAARARVTKVTVNNNKVKDTVNKVKEVKDTVNKVKQVKDILNRRRHNNKPMVSSKPHNRMDKRNHNSKRMHNQPQTNTILLLRHTLHQDKVHPPHKLTNNKLINNQPLKITNSKVMPLNLPHQLVNINNLQLQDSRDGSDR